MTGPAWRGLLVIVGVAAYTQWEAIMTAQDGAHITRLTLGALITTALLIRWGWVQEANKGQQT